MRPRNADPFLARIVQALKSAPDLLEALPSGLPPRDLRSLLLHVMAQRALARDPLSFLGDHARGGAVGWPPIDARAMHAIEGDALAAADAFDAIDLPPVVPHGATHALSGVHPNNVLAAMR